METVSVNVEDIRKMVSMLDTFLDELVEITSVGENTVDYVRDWLSQIIAPYAENLAELEADLASATAKCKREQCEFMLGEHPHSQPKGEFCSQYCLQTWVFEEEINMILRDKTTTDENVDKRVFDYYVNRNKVDTEVTLSIYTYVSYELMRGVVPEPETPHIWADHIGCDVEVVKQAIDEYYRLHEGQELNEHPFWGDLDAIIDGIEYDLDALDDEVSDG